MLSNTQVNAIKKEVEDGEDKLPLVFGALSDPGRYKIFKLLIKQSGLCVTDISHILGISVPAASQQLKIMEMSGLVNKTRSGQMICYTIKREDRLVRALKKIIER